MENVLIYLDRVTAEPEDTALYRQIARNWAVALTEGNPVLQERLSLYLKANYPLLPVTGNEEQKAKELIENLSLSEWLGQMLATPIASRS